MRRLTGWRFPSRNLCLVSWTCTRPLAPWEGERDEGKEEVTFKKREEGESGKEGERGKEGGREGKEGERGIKGIMEGGRGWGG